MSFRLAREPPVHKAKPGRGRESCNTFMMDPELETWPNDPPIEYGSKKTLGLKDNRVSICENRGSDAFREDNPDLFVRPCTMPVPAWTPPNRQLPCDAIRDELKAARASPRNGGFRAKYFIPWREIFYILTVGKIRAAVATLACARHMSGDKRDDLAMRIRYGSRTGDSPSARFFALLIMARQQELLLVAMDSGITDDCLPLQQSDKCSKSVVCGRHKSPHKIGDEVEWHFCQESFHFSSPYVRAVPGKHMHIVLEEEDVFPFRSKRRLSGNQHSDTGRGHMDRLGEEEKGQGGFGEVYQVELDEGHVSFQKLGLPKGRLKCALKMLYDHNRESFNLELASLLPFQPYPNLHLIQVLATFEVRSAEDDTSKFYFLFPYADGNMWDCFRRFNVPSERQARVPWVAAQCHALADALRLIHRERHHHVPHLSSHLSKDQEAIYGRHGDVKAENILCFFDNDCRLVFADFGLGRFHTAISRSVQDPRKLDFTATYRAPEFDTTRGKVSRKSDIYSLGCVFLETITWLLEGFDSAQTNFSDFRLENHAIRGAFEEDTFFGLEMKGDEVLATRKTKVSQWIKRLRQHPLSSTYVDDFLTFIDDRMLAPEAGTRATSSEVSKRLDVMAKACRQDSDYIRPHPPG